MVRYKSTMVDLQRTMVCRAEFHSLKHKDDIVLISESLSQT